MVWPRSVLHYLSSGLPFASASGVAAPALRGGLRSSVGASVGRRFGLLRSAPLTPGANRHCLRRCGMWRDGGAAPAPRPVCPGPPSRQAPHAAQDQGNSWARVACVRGWHLVGRAQACVRGICQHTVSAPPLHFCIFLCYNICVLLLFPSQFNPLLSFNPLFFLGVSMSVSSLLWSAFRAGGLASVAVVACPRSPSGVGLAFAVRGRLGPARFWRRAGRTPGAHAAGFSGLCAVVVPVAGCLPFVGGAAFPVAGGVRALPALAVRVGVALL